jgi:heterodisulfide reductase subunit A
MIGLPLGIAGDDLPRNLIALDLLRGVHRGTRIEAEGRRFLVVGGGDAAVDTARVLVRLGAASVRIVYRRGRDEMPAHAEEVDAAENEGIEILTRLEPVRILGAERVEGLRVAETEPGPPDADGRPRPVRVPDSETDIETDVVVSAVGQRPDLAMFDIAPALASDGSVEVDDKTGATSVTGVFAGGDLTPGPKTVIRAIADGRRAAYGIDLHLSPEDAEVEAVEFLNAEGRDFFMPRHLVSEPGHRTTLRPAELRRRDHDDVVVPLTEVEAKEEATRCLLCAMCSACSACTDLFGCPAFRQEDGRIVIDEALCDGCGVCVAFCPNGAIHEVSET